MEPAQVAQTAGSFHHVGFVVGSIPEAAERFVAALRMRWDCRIFHDPVQDVKVSFLEHTWPGAPMIELVEPASPDSHAARFLRRGGGLHHVCYEVESLDAQIETALSSGAILVREPAAAVAFGGREIAWVCTADRLLIEYLQRE
jgi:methylmalonyl-CoA/ethylmalonyl-CoA epimerase